MKQTTSSQGLFVPGVRICCYKSSAQEIVEHLLRARLQEYGSGTDLVQISWHSQTLHPGSAAPAAHSEWALKKYAPCGGDSSKDCFTGEGDIAESVGQQPTAKHICPA